MTAATILQVCFQKIIQAASLEEKKKNMFEMVAQYCVTMTARLLVLPWVLSGKCACCELKTHKKNKTASEVSALSSGQSGHCPECTPPHTQRYWDRLQSPPVTSNETRWEMRNCLMFFFFFLLYLEINLILTSLQSGDPQ